MSSKTDVMVKLALVFFISLLSFSIGTFVGKKYSDNQHQLAALEPQKSAHTQEREVASVSEHGTSEGKVGAMTDEEIAKLAEEFVADETTPATTENEVAPAHGEHAAPAGHHGEIAETKVESKEPKVETHKPNPTKGDKTPVTQHNEPSEAAKNVAAGKAPTTLEAAEKKVTAKEDRLPSSLPKDVAQFAVGKFTVQVASYADEAEAQKMASDLKNKGYSAFYIPANIKGKTWFRVSVGQFATQKEAQAYRTELVSKAKVGSAIVQKITE
ncbi:SPOR domain-containing protein [Bdellovibrio bacteriovorus]|uniref:SPOR domain-containing protein n=1 Tax=Bdellovibrio bacteriovorus TaxID=959 RepID=UPI0035A60C7F